MGGFRLPVPLRVSLLYALFGGGWILFSDILLNALVPDHTTYVAIQTYKGWAFVLASAVLIYLLVRFFLLRSQAAESGRQASENIYRQLFENSLDAVLLTTPEGGIQAANPAAVRIFKRAEAEIRQVGRAGLLDESEPRAAAAVAERAGSGRFHGELTFRRGDGTLFPGEVSSSLFTSPDGVGHAMITVRDVTERSRAADQLRLNERRLDYALRSAGLGAWNLDLIDRTSWRSDQHARIFGFKEASQAWGFQAFIAHVLPEDRPAAQAALEKGVTAHQEIDFECRIQREDGARRWIWVKASPELAPDGRPLKMFGIVQDITDRKAAELRLLRLNRLYATLGQINQVMVAARDRDGLLAAICRAAVEPGQYRMAWVGLVDENSQVVAPAFSAGAEQGYLSDIQIVTRDVEQGRGPTGAAIREGRCVVCQDIATDPRMEPWRAATLARGFRSSASVPFRQAGQVIGNLTVYADEAGAFGDDDLALLNEISGDISHALDRLETERARRQADAALREREARLSAVVENAGPAIWSVDVDSRLTMSNSQFHEFYSLIRPGQELALGSEFLPPTELEPARARVNGSISRALAGETVSWTNVFPDKSGQPHYYDGVVSPIHGPGGAVDGAVGVITDVTARRQAEEEIRLQAELLEWSHALVRDLDSRVVTWGRGVEQLYGYTPSEAAGRVSHELLQTRFPVSQADFESRLLADGVWEGELEHSRRDGARLRVASHQVLYRDHDGKPAAILEVNNDITALRQAEVDLQKRYKELAALYELAGRLQRLLPLDELSIEIISVLEGVLVYTLGAVLLLDETGASLYPFVLSAGDDGPRTQAENERFARSASLPLGQGLTGWAAAHGQSVRVDDVSLEPRYVALRPDIRSELCVPLRLQDKVIGVVNVESTLPGAYSADDQRLLETVAAQLAVAIQNSRLLEELRLNVARQAELSRRVSDSYESASRAIGLELHDQIGQMLTALKLTLSMLPRLGPEPAARKLADGRDLVDDLLGRVSRLSLQLRPPMLDDLGLLPTLIWHVNRYHQQTGVEVDFRHSGVEGRRFNPQVETNAYRIVQEALTNVARYSGASRADLRVTAGPDLLEIVLEDDGRGFDPQQALAGRRSTGLSGMRERAALLGGSFEITSQPGAGARVWVRLPLEELAS